MQALAKAVVSLNDVGKNDLAMVGGKGASLGEMINAGIPVPGGFAVTAQAFRDFLDRSGISQKLFDALKVDINDQSQLLKAEKAAKKLIMDARVPADIEAAIKSAYEDMIKKEGKEVFVAVRSSATAEDLPDASFAGQQETYLNVRGAQAVFDSVRKCWASLYGARAIFYRVEQGFEHEKVNLSAIVQKMVDSEKSGVMFSSEPSTGEPQAVVEGAWGLGESVVSGSVSPDNYVVDRASKKVLSKYIATKDIMIIKDPKTLKTVTIPVPAAKKDAQVLTEDEMVKLAEYAEILEKHYGIPQDIEWGVEGGKIYILQSRPITTIKAGAKPSEKATGSGEVLIKGLGASPGMASGVVRIIASSKDLDKVKPGDIMVTKMTMPDMVPGMKRAGAIVTDEGGMACHAAIVSRELGCPAVVGTKKATQVLKEGMVVTVDGAKGQVYDGNLAIAGAKSPEKATGSGEVLVKGLGASPGMASGVVRIIASSKDLDKVKPGDIMVTKMTMPDMVPGMKRAGAIVTDEGGMACHAAIVSRELGCPAVVGTKKATQVLKEGMVVTVDGAKGQVYDGNLAIAGAKPTATTPGAVTAVVSKPITATEVKVNISEPDRAEAAAATMADGVGLLRVEHMILGLGKTPNYYIKNGKQEEYIDELVKGIKKVADAFYPRPVWVRTLDAPTDEFRAMEGGENEPVEHNPMLGWRGIRRDLTEVEHFRLEVRAFKKLHELGLTNVGIMLPMVQHVRELRKAKGIMVEEGLDLEKIDVGIMVETPGAALTIDDFIEEGLSFVSFGTNDLTQYTLALDRNNENVASLYSEFHPAILKLIEYVVESCNEAGVKTSICGQAGSYPEMAKRLVKIGITSISANIDAVATVRETVARAEKILLLNAAREQ